MQEMKKEGSRALLDVKSRGDSVWKSASCFSFFAAFTFVPFTICDTKAKQVFFFFSSVCSMLSTLCKHSSLKTTATKEHSLSALAVLHVGQEVACTRPVYRATFLNSICNEPSFCYTELSLFVYSSTLLLFSFIKKKNVHAHVQFYFFVSFASPSEVF